jgi:tRNA(adenine34) deaminase
MSTKEHFMKIALEQAQLAAEQGEVPVGAVVVLDNEIISMGHNEVEVLHDATAHAEILALRRASEKLRRWRLNDCELFVTLEPCTMCAGAIISARISKLYFGCYDEKRGAVGSIYNVLEGHLKIYPEVLAQESAQMLRRFFDKRR